ncbi:MAG: hypothetical protein PX483_04395 [Nostocales cyanobacterium LE14-WE4]|jgi:hypothetical protein|uniref:hypothetical protein n=1 Tax=Nostocales TaxID=1161 RepID=UPI000800EA7E|nr:MULTISPECIES: hypothetical protein [Nostocales]MBS9386881.1 hypothetical protein [Dolichospermum sp. BR01]MCE2697068.1 hypothetical protein [Anabaena sp. 49633_E8]MDJ0500091.1 hypothetical protein [Nostocales cyanobacterium LE14-WE4]MCE2701282.1 hypothetical protein [Anabaena sp. 49633_E8]MDB9450106.1 hypothetical protein [Dolichospermum circinale CS-547]
MPTIFELFGFPVDDRSEEVEIIRKSRQCPFMGATCDGGGNRYQTKIKLTQQESLTHYFNSDVTEVIPGVCSIQSGQDIWVVCPHRLFSAKFDGEGVPSINRAVQQYERDLLIHAGLPTGTDIGAWAEVSLKHRVADAEINYHFDYVLAPLVETSLNSLLKQSCFLGSTKEDLDDLIKVAKKSGYFQDIKKNLADVSILIPDIYNPFILEVMTASTSGSDTENSTDMRSAFRNALLVSEHTSPGINKRQVWGRMVTQLFAKTALAHEWNGQTIWVIQDALLRNIELTTRLKTVDVPSNPQRNISLVIMQYFTGIDGKKQMSLQATIDGDAGINFDGSNTFTDILLPKLAPPKVELLKAILRRKLNAIFRL